MSDNKMKSLEDLFEHQLKDLYNAKNQVADTLQSIIDKVSGVELQRLLNQHLEESREHVRMIEDVCKGLDIDPSGETCKAMKGIISEAKSMMNEKATEEVMDAALIAEVQRIEHYEIAGYGTACTYAGLLNHYDEKKTLGKILDQDKEMDVLLTELAQRVNQEAEV